MTNPAFAADQLLSQALVLHRAGRLAEAEALYNQVLRLHPGNPDVLLNCALAQLGQNKLAAAESSLRSAIALKSDVAKPHYHLGDVLCRQGNFQSAVAAYRRCTEIKPDYAEAYNNLGNALLHLGEKDSAQKAYRKAVAVKPDFPLAHNNLGHIYLGMGEFEMARAALARAISLAPNFAEAHNNLGHAFHRLQHTGEAQAAFRTAIRLDPRLADAHANLAVSLMTESKYAEAEQAALDAIRLNPQAPQAHDALGNALRAQGRLAEAENCYREAIRLQPDFAEGHNHLAMIFEEYGRLDDAVVHFKRHAELAYGPPHGPAETSPHKQRHDQEQSVWRGRETAFYLADAPRLSGPAVNPSNRVAAISQEWRTKKPQIVVVDDLLTPEALQSLRNFCLASTVWQKSFDEGYLGALPEHGFATPLIAQIAEELRSVYPVLIGDHPLLHFWGFKYDSGLKGINVHADFAAVNVNFWITPDDANLDPEHGGLVLWDVAAPLDWDFTKYNAGNDEIRAFLAREKAKSVTIPYRANRAVIFDSDLFHQTDVIHFKPGYENRRINVTLLYGRREK